MERISMKTKKVLILTADAGFGHRSAANAISAAISEKYGKFCQVDIVNPLEDRRVAFFLRDSQSDYDKIVREIPELYKFGYNASDSAVPVALVESSMTVLLFEVMSDILETYRPGVILSTYPFYQAPLTSIFAIRNRWIPYYTVITDLATIHRLWFSSSVDALMVPNEVVRDLAISQSVPPEKLIVTGIPVHPDIYHEERSKKEIRANLGWDPDLPTFLAVGSKRVEGMLNILQVFNHFGLPLQLVVAAGKDENLYEQLKKIEWHIPVHLYEYTDQMPSFMLAADAIICKAGGLVVTESLACGLPLMLIDIIPGQETGNADYVIQNGAGDLAPDAMTALEVLSHWMQNGARLLKLRSEIACKLGKPQAAYTIADIAWEALQHRVLTNHEELKQKRVSLIDLLSRNHIHWEGTKRIRGRRTSLLKKRV
jgi:1,2-diacylglycerol 3-beta-galactosyltransferase